VPVPQSPFLDAGEYQRFTQDYHQFPRHIERVNDAAGAAPRKPQHREVDEFAAQQLRELLRFKHARFAGLAVAVHEGDGMSWSATAVDQALAEAEGNRKLQRVYLRGEAAPGRLPEIATVIPRRTFAALAQKHHLTRSFRFVGRGAAVGLTLASIVLAVLATVLLTFTQSTSPSLLRQPAFWAAAVALAVVAILAQKVNARVSTETRSKAMEQLAKDLENPDEGRAHRDFADALAEQLSRPRGPRRVIVDGFDRLDPTTKATIHSYFQNHTRKATHSDLWVIFENAVTLEFRREALLAHAGHGYQRTKHFDQLLLTDDQRRDLAAYDDQPLRDGAYTVRQVRRPQLGGGEAFHEFFEQQRIKYPWSEDRYQTLEFFMLLSLTAAWGGTTALPRSYLEYGFAEKGRPRSEVLASFLRGSDLKTNEFRAHLHNLEKDFGPCMRVNQDGPSKEYHLKPDWALALIQDGAWSRYKLPDPGLGHLFWALFWHDKIQNHPLQAFWVHKLTRHILQSSRPTLLGGTLSQGVTDALFEATDFAVKSSLRCCLLDDLPDLLSLALELIDEDDDAWFDRAQRLLDHAWEAFTVLGHEQILRVVLDLERWRTREASRQRPPQADALERLFLQSTSLSSQGQAPRLEALVLARTQADPAVRTYARTRAAWLALTLNKFLHTGVLPYLEQARTAGTQALPSLVRDTLDRLEQAPPEERLAVDFMSLSLGLWCLALSLAERRVDTYTQELDQLLARRRTDDAHHDQPAPPSLTTHASPVLPEADELTDLLLEAALLVRELRQERSSSGDTGRLGFVTDGLVKELAVMVLSCTALLGTVHDRRSLEAIDHRRLQDAVEMAVASLGTKPPALHHWDDVAGAELRGKAEQQADLLQLTWRIIGVDQLASLIGVRGAHLHVLTGAPAEDVALLHEVLTGLAGEVETPGHLGLLANAVAARSVETSHEIVATLLCRGVAAAIQASFGEQLATELCILAIGHAHSYAINLDAFLGFLIQPSSTTPQTTRLAGFLADLPDGELAKLALWLLNALTNTDQPDLAEDIPAALLLRAAPPTDTAAADEVRQRVDLFELRNALHSGQVVDVEKTIDQWTGSKERGNYAWLLYLLISNDCQPFEPLVREATKVLAGAGRNVDSSSYVHLATDVASRLSYTPPETGGHNQDAAPVAVDFLERVIHKWESQLTAEQNIQILRLLLVNHPERQQRYEDRLLHWEVIRHERDRIKLLPTLMEAGRFFMLFLHYYRVLEFWGLPTEIPRDQMWERLRIGADDRQRLVNQWQATGEPDLPPFIQSDGRACLSSEFLVLGSCLFSSPSDADPDLEHPRQRFDHHARRALTNLYKEMTSLETIPLQIREILQRHRDRFLQHTMPT
jgi:hypothetical protein